MPRSRVGHPRNLQNALTQALGDGHGSSKGMGKDNSNGKGKGQGNEIAKGKGKMNEKGIAKGKGEMNEKGKGYCKGNGKGQGKNTSGRRRTADEAFGDPNGDNMYVGQVSLAYKPMLFNISPVYGLYYL